MRVRTVLSGSWKNRTPSTSLSYCASSWAHTPVLIAASTNSMGSVDVHSRAQWHLCRRTAHAAMAARCGDVAPSQPHTRVTHHRHHHTMP